MFRAKPAKHSLSKAKFVIQRAIYFEPIIFSNIKLTTKSSSQIEPNIKYYRVGTTYLHPLPRGKLHRLCSGQTGVKVTKPGWSKSLLLPLDD